MKELPKIDLPEEWLIGTGVNKALLSLYTNFPCRLKSEIFVLCMEGEIEASVNLNRITVRANDFVTIMPGSILQIHSVNGEPMLYFVGLYYSITICISNINHYYFRLAQQICNKNIIKCCVCFRRCFSVCPDPNSGVQMLNLHFLSLPFDWHFNLLFIPFQVQIFVWQNRHLKIWQR